MILAWASPFNPLFNQQAQQTRDVEHVEPIDAGSWISFDTGPSSLTLIQNYTDIVLMYVLAGVLKQEAQGPWRLSTALQKISYKCVRECISIL